MTQETVLRPIRFDPAAPVDPSAPTTTHEWYQDRTGAFSAGLWASEPSTLEVNYEEDEFCLLLDGTVELTDAEGRTEAFKAGDAFVIPAGFSGTWRNVTAVRKYYVIHLAKGPAA